MGILVVILLGGLWASILLPGALRSRRNSSPIDSILAFERSMSLLAPRRPDERHPGRHVMVLDRPASLTGRVRADVLARQRLALFGMAAATVLSAVLALAFGGAFVALFALVALAFATYVTVLRRRQARAAEIRAKIRHLHRAPDTAPVEEIRRYGT
ncbi:MAG: hypothetical protein M3415_04365 [Actinomycetota bacterium]|nr:hypothetical protein [Actinomycetota bacterium]